MRRECVTCNITWEGIGPNTCPDQTALDTREHLVMIVQTMPEVGDWVRAKVSFTDVPAGSVFEVLTVDAHRFTLRDDPTGNSWFWLQSQFEIIKPPLATGIKGTEATKTAIRPKLPLTTSIILTSEQHAIVISLLSTFKNETYNHETHKMLEQTLKELFNAPRFPG